MDSKHIHAAFDEEITKITTQVMIMGGLVENALRQATKSLLRQDIERADQVIVQDNRVDLLEEQITVAAIELLALRQPQANDLRTIIAIMKIVTSLERVGDYARNIARRTPEVANVISVKDFGSGSIKRLSKSVVLQIKTSLDSFMEKDIDQAQGVIDRDEEIDQMYNSLFREFLTHMMEDPRNISTTMHYLFIAKNLERIGDHTTAIAEQVIYMISGSIPKDGRPKLVSTSYDELL
ncbi:MAG: phosphate signaling complex protein PhoU [Rhodobacteraceae bacterium]|nr:phosphate signaling complex protein PhoU [Paracoccaceae bacterium]